MPTRPLLALAGFAALLVGCGGAEPEPPVGLAYSSNPAVYVVGDPIAPNVATTGGGRPTSFVVTPPLPSGLVCDLATGVISGTPTIVTPTAGYAVIAGNPGGHTAASLVLTVVARAAVTPASGETAPAVGSADPSRP